MIISDGAMISEDKADLEMQVKYKQTLEENVQLKAIMRDWVKKAATEKEALVRLAQAKKEASKAMEVAKAKINMTEACTIGVAWKYPKKSGSVSWGGKCHTLEACQEKCDATDGCTAFNWWPKRGGCRLYLVSLEDLNELPDCGEKTKAEWKAWKKDSSSPACKRETTWPTIGGSSSCTCDDEAKCVGPKDIGRGRRQCPPEVEEELDEDEDM